MNLTRRIMLTLTLGLSSCAWMIATPIKAAEKQITVFAAASMVDVLETLAARYRHQTGIKIRMSFASTAALAKQIESGAKADLFISADERWVEYLLQKQRLQSSSRVTLASNELVLIVPSQMMGSVKLAPGVDLTPLLGRRGRWVTADPESVPLGRYAKSALQSLGIWEALASKIVSTENARTALNLVARGEAPFGIVYASDAKSSAAVKVLDTFPAKTHPAITYPALLVNGASVEAARFLRFLQSAEALSVFGDAGFEPTPP